jgi:hypothetical protein
MKSLLAQRRIAALLAVIVALPAYRSTLACEGRPFY